MAKRRSNDDGWVGEGDDDIDDDGRDDDGFDDSEHDEADQKRFSSDVAYCPECGAEVIDDADICPKCFTWIDGTTHSRPSRFRRSLHLAVVVMLIVAAVVGCVGIALLMR
ncbi:MAG: zinc-ribbon domain [Planctomycetota bacterium]|jgi:ribosomal protein L40E